jgi:hypothetical protein
VPAIELPTIAAAQLPHPQEPPQPQQQQQQQQLPPLSEQEILRADSNDQFQLGATERVNQDAAVFRPRNTNHAYDRVKAEWTGYCEAVPLKNHWSRGIISSYATEKRLFVYLFYHAHRVQRPRNESHHHFDFDEYCTVLNDHPPNEEIMFDDVQRAYVQFGVIEGVKSGVMSLVTTDHEVSTATRLNANIHGYISYMFSSH